MTHAPISPSPEEEHQKADEALRRDVVLPELVEAANLQGQFAIFNPTKPTPGEKLQDDLFSSSAGFLISKVSAKITLNPDKVQKEIDYFSKKVVIAYFLGGPKRLNVLIEWLRHVKSQI